MPIDADKAIRPHIDYELEARSPILHDGKEGHTGVSGMVDNQSTLWARAGHMLVSEVPYLAEYDLALSSTFYTVGTWVCPLPQWLNDAADVGRRYLMVFVAASASAGSTETDWTWRATRSDGTVLTTGGTWTTLEGQAGRLLELPIPAHTEGAVDGRMFDFSLQVFKGAVAHTLTVESVHAWIRRSPDERNRMGYIELADTVQAEWRTALDVYTARSLMAANDIMFCNNTRAVVTKGLGAALEVGKGFLLGDGNGGAIILRDDAGAEDVYPSPYWEWLYYPRQGVRTLELAINATAGAVLADERELRASFAGYPNSQTPYKTKVEATYNWESWSVGGLSGGRHLLVPEGPGPFRLRLELIPSTTVDTIVYVHQIIVFETGQVARAFLAP